MGKPRLIVLIRHAQSEGNLNRSIHQMVPDHRVKLTEEGWKQAEEAGHRLRALLNPTDSLQIFTSPYRRTRETTEGILRTLTSSAVSNTGTTTTAPAAAPFSRNKITVYEEPRLREQDFGNFQPDSSEMERMWRERADYGHFFYRIPNGESAADAYDRVSGFNESLWRQFGEKDFPSVLVLVTHGLMTRVFLMKWYHWSVEYFEDLRNVNHCEFMVMRRDLAEGGSGKYVLENTLRTWSELKRQRQQDAQAREKIVDPLRRNTLSAFLKMPQKRSPSLSAKKGEGAENGDLKDAKLPPVAVEAEKSAVDGQNEGNDQPLARKEPVAPSGTGVWKGVAAVQTTSSKATGLSPFQKIQNPPSITSGARQFQRPTSGAATPHEQPSESEDELEQSPKSKSKSYFPQASPGAKSATTSSAAMTPARALLGTALRPKAERKPTPEDVERWLGESGMGRRAQADALGDEPTAESQELEDGDEAAEKEKAADEMEKGVKGSVY